MSQLPPIISSLSMKLRLLASVLLLLAVVLFMSYRGIHGLEMWVFAGLFGMLLYVLVAREGRIYLTTAAVTLSLLLGMLALPFVDFFRPELAWQDQNIYYFARPRLGDYLLVLLYLMPILLALSFTQYCMRVNKSHRLASILLDKAPDPSKGRALRENRAADAGKSKAGFRYEELDQSFVERCHEVYRQVRNRLKQVYFSLGLLSIIGLLCAWHWGIPHLLNTSENRKNQDRHLIHAWTQGEGSDYSIIHALDRLVKQLNEDGIPSTLTPQQLEQELGLDQLSAEQRQSAASMRFDERLVAPTLSIYLPDSLWLRLFIFPEEGGAGLVKELRLSIEDSRVYDIFLQLKARQSK